MAGRSVAPSHACVRGGVDGPVRGGVGRSLAPSQASVAGGTDGVPGDAQAGAWPGGPVGGWWAGAMAGVPGDLGFVG